MAFFSIIIPIYNVKPYLAACLNSVKTQSFEDFEAILVDDGSTDGSLAIAREFANDDKRFILISQENMGLSQARNTALRFLTQRAETPKKENAANEGYILFLDSDDYFQKDALKTISNILKDNQVDILKYSYEFMPYKPIPKSFEPALYQSGTDFILQNPSILGEGCVWLYAISLRFFLNHKFSFIPQIYFEDMTFIADILMHAKSIYISDAPLYTYRLREDSITRATWDEKRTFKAFESYLAIMEHHHKLMHKTNNQKIKKIFKKLIYAYIWCFYHKEQESGYRASPELYKKLHVYEKHAPIKNKLQKHCPRIYQALRRIKQLLRLILQKFKMQ